MVVTYHYGTVRVAENNLGSHVDKLIYEEQAALEHLLMEEYAATSLRCHHQEYRQKIWRKSWPRCICQRHDGSVDKGIYHIVLLLRDNEVITLYLHLHAQTAESIRNDTQILN